jgi:hypothetical protein
MSIFVVGEEGLGHVPRSLPATPLVSCFNKIKI